MTDDENTPPVNSFGAQRQLSRELDGIRRQLAEQRQLILIGLVLLCVAIGASLVLALVR